MDFGPYGSLEEMLMEANMEGAVDAECPECGAIRRVEPDAENYKCFEPDCVGRITSPLRKAGLI